MAEEAAEDDGPNRAVSLETAARMLGESVAYLLELLDSGAIASETVNGVRVVEVARVTAFGERRARATDAVAEIAKLVEKSPGGWDR